MTIDKYKVEADKLSVLIDIAIKAIQTYPPKIFNEATSKQFIKTYLEFKNDILNPTPQYRNIKSLNSVKQNALIFFQESSGDAVNYFWKEINKLELGITRVNKLEKILKKNKISNQAEFDYIIDTLVPAKQEGLITTEEVEILSKLIGKFEGK